MISYLHSCHIYITRISNKYAPKTCPNVIIHTNIVFALSRPTYYKTIHLGEKLEEYDGNSKGWFTTWIHDVRPWT